MCFIWSRECFIWSRVCVFHLVAQVLLNLDASFFHGTREGKRQGMKGDDAIRRGFRGSEEPRDNFRLSNGKELCLQKLSRVCFLSHNLNKLGLSLVPHHSETLAHALFDLFKPTQNTAALV